MESGRICVNQYVADTHALYWYLCASPHLGANAKSAFDEAVAGRAQILVPSIVLAELFFLNEKAGNPLRFEDEFSRLASAGQFQFVPFDAEDVLDFSEDAQIPEMHDRIIAGAARRAGAACLTRDTLLSKHPSIRCVW